jgi:ribonucleoside-diphosphate reductase alpha chain
MKVFDAATEAIKQGGRRRGASMGVLSVDHPDIQKFIHSKEDLHSLSNFNISVSVTDDFMEKARKRSDYNLVNPRSEEVVGKMNAAEVLDDICSMAWKTGDPGLIFIDPVNRVNPTPGLGDIEATNPCGEVPLLPYEACNLGSINLDRITAEVSGEYRLDWNRFRELVDAGVRFLDNVIDASRYPLPQIRDMVSKNRKIGLGVMGYADALIKLGISYRSEESLVFAEKVIKFVKDEAEKTTKKIGTERGDFPNIAKSIHRSPRRNATVLSIAPTGTISMIASCSSGIEPLYAISYVKHVLDGEHLLEVNPEFVRVAKERGFYSEELIRMLSLKRSTQDVRSIPEDVRSIFLTSYDVLPERQVEVQATFQRYVDNAVSKTIILPETSTPDDVKAVYLEAFRKGCKGITVYREGSKTGQVLTTIEDQTTCPECGNYLRVEEGAFVCRVCGYFSK